MSSRPKIVFVRWLDASYVGADWNTPDNLKDENGFLLESCGFLVGQDKRGIFIATDYDPEADKRFRHVSFIPHGMVKKKRVFTVK